jgi:hypothetical protein
MADIPLSLTSILNPTDKYAPTYVPPPSTKSFNPTKAISLENTNIPFLKSPSYDLRKEAVKDLEAQIIKSQLKCPNKIIDNLRVRTFQLDPETINIFLVNGGLFDHKFQDGLSCLLDALIDDDERIPDTHLRRWITDIKKIGAASVEGSVFNLDMSHNPLFAVKLPKDDSNLNHEAIIGMGIINKLSDRIPNFVHTYGAFMCAPPLSLLTENPIVNSWCSSKHHPITYLVLENIGNSVTLGELAWVLTEIDFLAIYIQVVNAINVANKDSEFTHYDLHSNNVLIQTMTYDIIIPIYLLGDGVKYLKTKHLARIIDFGSSYVVLQGQQLGKYDYEKYDVYPDHSFPLGDVYKLLLFTYYKSLYNTTSHRKSSNLTTIVNQLHQYLNPKTTADERVAHYNNDEDYYFTFPHKLTSLTLDNFLQYMINIYHPNFITDNIPEKGVLTICKDKCLTWSEFNRTIFDQNRLPTTFEDYSYAITAINKLSDLSYKTQLIDWLRQFDIIQAYNYEYPIMVREVTQTLNKMSSSKLRKITDPKYNVLEYKNDIEQLVKFQWDFNWYELWATVTKYAFVTNNKFSLIEDSVNDILDDLFVIQGILLDNREIVTHNDKIMREINSIVLSMKID